MNLGDVSARMQKLNSWALEASSITKEIEFSSLKQAASFLSKLSEFLESINYSPDIVLINSKLRITLKLEERDFNIAEQIDKISLSI